MTEQVKPYPLISEAIRNGDKERLAALLRAYPEMIDLDVPGFGTWLHYACANGTLEIADLLVEMGFDVNASDKREGQRPLSGAAEENKYDIACFLLDKGAEMDVSTSVRNPLFAAIVGRSPEIANLLLMRGIDAKASYDSDTMKNMDAVAFAMMHGAHEIAHMIALHNADGDEAAAQAAMAEGLKIAHENTTPVPSGQDVRPS